MFNEHTWVKMTLSIEKSKKPGSAALPVVGSGR